MPILNVSVNTTVKQKTKLDKYVSKYLTHVPSLSGDFATIELYFTSLLDERVIALSNEISKNDGTTLQVAFDAATPTVQGQVNTLLGT